MEGRKGQTKDGWKEGKNERTKDGWMKRTEMNDG